MQNNPISVAITDDHSLLRQGIRTLLCENERVSILFDAQNGLDLQKKIGQYGVPNVILMDVNMPVMDGYQATLWVKTKYPEVNVLALSMDDAEDKIIRMIRCGAGGYVMKTSTIDELLEGILTIAQTGTYLNEHITGSLLRNVRGEIKNDSLPEAVLLTAREKEVLYFCCSEMTYKEIATRMHISIHTLNNYREDLGNKLAIRSRIGLVLYAFKKGIVNVDQLPDM